MPAPLRTVVNPKANATASRMGFGAFKLLTNPKCVHSIVIWLNDVFPAPPLFWNFRDFACWLKSTWTIGSVISSKLVPSFVLSSAGISWDYFPSSVCGWARAIPLSSWICRILIWWIFLAIDCAWNFTSVTIVQGSAGYSCIERSFCDRPIVGIQGSLDAYRTVSPVKSAFVTETLPLSQPYFVVGKTRYLRIPSYDLISWPFHYLFILINWLIVRASLIFVSNSSSLLYPIMLPK